MPEKLSRAAADGPIRTGRSEQRADNVHNGRTVNRIVLPQKRERVQRRNPPDRPRVGEAVDGGGEPAR
jgi:hypothetical protein